MICHVEAAAIDHQGCAFFDAGINVTQYLVCMDSADQRAHVWLGLAHAIADRHLLDLALQVFDQVVSDFITHADGHRDRHATLTGTAVGGANQ